MRDEDHGEPELALKLFQQAQDLRLDHDVERRRGFVGDDQTRTARQSHRDHHPLALAARQLVRIVPQPPRRESHLFEERARPNQRLPLAGLTVQDDGFRDLVPDPLHGVQRVHRPLEHDRSFRPPHGAELLVVQQHPTGDVGPLRQEPKDRARDR